jgi:ElaB/YqjD/DUF883 family membrane-anchored ribosome-binding protein
VQFRVFVHYEKWKDKEMNILDKELTHADQDSEMLLYEQSEAQKREIEELRAQLARCIEALEYLLSVNVGEADVEYGTACKNAEDAIRLAKE